MTRDDGAPEDDSSAPSGEHGLGAHLDRLLRAAEQEAVQIREVAERRAAALPTEAHAGSPGTRRTGVGNGRSGRR